MDTTQADGWSRMIDDLWHAHPLSKLVPLSPGVVSAVFQSMWQESLRNPAKGWADYVDFVSQSTQIWTNAAMQFWGVAPPAGKEPASVISPEAGDKRFNAPDWQSNAAFNAIKQSYLLSATTLLKSASNLE